MVGGAASKRGAVPSTKIIALSLAYVSGALIDDVLTYLYVRSWGLYEEANPFIALYWMDKPLWMWLARDLSGLLVALLASLAYGRLMDFLISVSGPNIILSYMRRAWLWPLCLAALIRCLPVVHNLLLIFFNVKTPLAALFTRPTFVLGGHYVRQG